VEACSDRDVCVLLVRLVQELRVLWRRQGQSCCYLLPAPPHIAVCDTGDCLDGEQDNTAVIWDVVSCGLVHRCRAGGGTAMCSRVGMCEICRTPSALKVEARPWCQSDSLEQELML
jgi:hypothetical protein